MTTEKKKLSCSFSPLNTLLVTQFEFLWNRVLKKSFGNLKGFKGSNKISGVMWITFGFFPWQMMQVNSRWLHLWLFASHVAALGMNFIWWITKLALYFLLIYTTDMFWGPAIVYCLLYTWLIFLYFTLSSVPPASSIFISLSPLLTAHYSTFTATGIWL